MNDLIIQGDPDMKLATLTKPVPVMGMDGVQIGYIALGTVLEFLLEYLYPALDNNPTPLNKSTLLSEETERLIWGDIKEET